MGIDFVINDDIEIEGDVDVKLFRSFLAKLVEATQQSGHYEDYSGFFSPEHNGAKYVFRNVRGRGDIYDVIMWVALIDLCVLRPNGWFIGECPFSYRGGEGGCYDKLTGIVKFSREIPGKLSVYEFNEREKGVRHVVVELSKTLPLALVGQLTGRTVLASDFSPDAEEYSEIRFFDAEGHPVALPHLPPPASYLSGMSALDEFAEKVTRAFSSTAFVSES